MSTLGIDIGTTGCKVGAFSEDGSQLGFAYRGYALSRPQQGWCELPAKKVWSSICSAIRQVADYTRRDPVQSLCVSALGEAVTPVNLQGEILADSIVSSDIRGSDYAEALAAGIPFDEFYAINPNIISPNYSYPKIAWIRDNRPDLYDNTDKFLLWDGLVSRLLGGQDFVSYSLANRTLLFDLHKQSWSEKLLKITGIDVEKLPTCLPAGTVAGKVRPDIAQSLRLPNDVTIVVGGHDQCVNALGCGIAGPDCAAVGIGTYECITPVYPKRQSDGEIRSAGLNVEHYLIPGLYVSFLFNQGGSLISWFNRTFAKECARDDLHGIQNEMPSDPTRLLVLPYFEPTGSPGYVNDASGVIFGLKMDTTRGEILKAIMESTSFYFLETWKALDLETTVTSMVASGGGSRSDQWLQIKADIFGVPVLRPAVNECGVLGAAMLAQAVLLAERDLSRTLPQMASHWVSIEKQFDPDTRRNNAYRERFAHYQNLFPSLQRNLRQWHKYLHQAL